MSVAGAEIQITTCPCMSIGCSGKIHEGQVDGKRGQHLPFSELGLVKRRALAVKSRARSKVQVSCTQEEVAW